MLRACIEAYSLHHCSVFSSHGVWTRKESTVHGCHDIYLALCKLNIFTGYCAESVSRKVVKVMKYWISIHVTCWYWLLYDLEKMCKKKVLQIFFKLMKFSWWLHGALHKWGDCSYYQWTNTDILSWKHWVIFLQIFFPMIRNIKQELIDQRDLFFLNSAQPDLNIHTTKDWRLDIGQLTLSMDAFEQK